MTSIRTRVVSSVPPTCSCSPSQFGRACRSGTRHVSNRARQTTRAGGVDESQNRTPHTWLKVEGPFHDWEASRRALASDNWPRGASYSCPKCGPKMWFPVDVDEYLYNYTLIADIPGVEKKNVKVQVNRDRKLTISGHREKGMSSRQSMNYSRAEWSLSQERRFGKFKRSWPLPSDANIEQVSACVEQGVLAVFINKKQPDESEVTSVPVY